MSAKRMNSLFLAACLLSSVWSSGPLKAQGSDLRTDRTIPIRQEGPVGSGSPIGNSWFPISWINNESSHHNEEFPAVAYNSSQQEYLVVWEQSSDDGYRAVYGRRLSKAGAPVSSWFRISPDMGINKHARVAYDSAHNNYLVVYEVEGAGIYGQRIGGSGGYVGTEFNIVSQAGYSFHEPVVAYASLSDHYLVAWRRDEGTVWKGIEARPIPGNGTTPGTILEITGMIMTEPSHPALAYNSALDQFLVVWQKWDSIGMYDYDIWGQRIHMEGGVHLEGLPFGIHTTIEDAVTPAVGVISQYAGTGNYLVAFQTDNSGTIRIYGQVVAGDGTLGIGRNISPSFGYLPAVAGNENTREYLVAWASGGQIQVRIFFPWGTMGESVASLPHQYPNNPAVVAGPLGDFLVVDDAFLSLAYPVDVFGWLWGIRIYLPIIFRDF